MNNIINKDFLKAGAIFLIFAAILMLVFTACSKKIHFAQSTVVPAAEGTIKWKKDKNRNYFIEAKVIRLAEPDRLTPPKKLYVLWMNTKQNGVKNIGKLKISSGMLSKMLRASLQTVTSFEPVSFFITAERDGSAQYPGDQVVLVTKK